MFSVNVEFHELNGVYSINFHFGQICFSSSCNIHIFTLYDFHGGVGLCCMRIQLFHIFLLVSLPLLALKYWSFYNPFIDQWSQFLNQKFLSVSDPWLLNRVLHIQHELSWPHLPSQCLSLTACGNIYFMIMIECFDVSQTYRVCKYLTGGITASRIWNGDSNSEYTVLFWV